MTSLLYFIIIIIVMIIITFLVIYSLKPKIEDSQKGFPDSVTNKYKILTELGRGGFGTVFLAQNRYSGKNVAIKTINRGSCVHEAKLMMSFNHAHIIRAFDQAQTPSTNFIIMEYMSGGSLLSRLNKRGKFTEPLTKLYLYQMCEAVRYLHEKGATHRDLKPDNILMACESDVTLIKISDFGLSHCCFTSMHSIVGNWHFRAPEVEKGQYGPKVDIWGLYLILLLCLGNNFPKSVSRDVKSLINSMGEKDPVDRIDIKTVLASSWLNDEKMKQTVEWLQKKFN